MACQVVIDHKTTCWLFPARFYTLVTAEPLSIPVQMYISDNRIATTDSGRERDKEGGEGRGSF